MILGVYRQNQNKAKDVLIKREISFIETNAEKENICVSRVISYVLYLVFFITSGILFVLGLKDHAFRSFAMFILSYLLHLNAKYEIKITEDIVNVKPNT